MFDTRYILGAKKLPASADLGLPYVLPQVGLYRQVKGAGLNFSFVETDRTGPSLITGTYADQELGAHGRALAAGLRRRSAPARRPPARGGCPRATSRAR